jgi:hypothetical protein
VHKAIDKAGYFGIALYILGFGLAELLHLPGMVFVAGLALCTSLLFCSQNTNG